ncbi:MAG: putative ABC transporter permease, partial [Clostridia bacterium]|nr:putative ABC transporter permease [Clostridia bacterium]
GKLYDRGFMTLPFCPIYGLGVMSAYFLLGTPQQGKGILKNVEGSYRRMALYLIFAFLIPTLAEYAVGYVFDKAFSLRLWSYAGRPLNINGYVCIPVSVVWSVALTTVMRFVFLPLKRLVFRISDKLSVILAVTLFVAMAWDTVWNFTKL